MPFHEYECPNGHITERFFKTISEGEKVLMIPCKACPMITESDENGVTQVDVMAIKIPSAPLGFGLYGNPEGYGNPSPTKRWNTKVVSSKTGNDSSIG